MRDKMMLAGVAILVAVGCVGAVMVLLNGHKVFGTDQHVTWGILISSYEFFAASSTGVCMIAMWGILRREEALLKPLKQLLILALALLVGAFTVIGLELGQPLHGINMLLSPNFGSPILWMIILYGVYMVLLFGLLFFVHKQEFKLGRRLGIITLIVAFLATVNMGVLLSFIQARPFWHGFLLPVYFVVTGLASGMAFIVLALFWKTSENSAGFSQLVRMLRMLLIGSAVLVLFKMTSSFFAGSTAAPKNLQVLLFGPLSLNFWLLEVSIGIVLPLALLYRAEHQCRFVFYGSLAVLIGVFTMRYDLLIAGQMVSNEVIYAVGALQNIPYHVYSPSFAEWGIVVLGFGLAGLIYLAGMATFAPEVPDRRSGVKNIRAAE